MRAEACLGTHCFLCVCKALILKCVYTYVYIKTKKLILIMVEVWLCLGSMSHFISPTKDFLFFWTRVPFLFRLCSLLSFCLFSFSYSVIYLLFLSPSCILLFYLNASSFFQIRNKPCHNKLLKNFFDLFFRKNLIDG